MNNFIITTTPTIEDWIIEDYLGPVISNEVFGVNVIADAIASFSDFFGGASGMYRSQLNDLQARVLADLTNKALEKGAHAIVGFNIDFNEITGKGKQMFMVTASGTAVKLGQNRLKFARKLHELNRYHEEGILTDEEYEFELDALNDLKKKRVAPVSIKSNISTPSDTDDESPKPSQEELQEYYNSSQYSDMWNQ